MLLKLFSILSLIITPVFSWGPQGHIAVANIAQTLITSNTYNSISNLIPGGNMSSVANWADEVRSLPEWKWSVPLHFINTPSWNCSYIRERDCYNGVDSFLYCVDGAIQNNTNLLVYSSYDPDYLKFLIHFVGDIHQPLHCGFKEDLGGNDIKVIFNNKHTELHAVWDSGMIEQRVNTDFNDDYTAWNNYLINTYVSPFNETCVESDGMCSEIWGNESTDFACRFSYVKEDGITKIQSGDSLDVGYYNKNIKIIEIQLAKAGIRLANLLNAIFQA
jgi:hypothetical protein